MLDAQVRFLWSLFDGEILAREDFWHFCEIPQKIKLCQAHLLRKLEIRLIAINFRRFEISEHTMTKVPDSV